MRIALLVFGVVCISSLASADTTWVAAGNVSGEWTSVGSPYMVLGNVTVPEGETLAINNGVRVFMNGAYGITVNGRLQALGAETDSVVFTCDTLRATNGWGGIHMGLVSQPLELSYCILEFTGYGYTGAIQCVACSTEVSHSTFRYSLSGHGGAIYARQGGYAVLDNCVLGYNIRGGGCGGVINAAENSQIRLSSCRVKGSTSLDGGAFCLYDSELKLDSCVVEENFATLWGPLFVDGTSVVHAIATTFSRNHSLTAGLVDCRESAAVLRFERCLFVENYATEQNAPSVIWSYSDSLTVDRCTFVRNGPGPGGVIRATQPCIIRNSIIAYTQAPWALQTSGGTEVEFCDFYGNDGEDMAIPPFGFGAIDTVNVNGDSCDQYFNLFLDPLFADTSLDNYALTSQSPCIDAGDPASTPDPDGSVADMGARYFDQATRAEPAERATVRQYGLDQNYPNPFNAVTTIGFSIERSGYVSLRVYDIAGRVVATLVDGAMAAGEHGVNFDASGLPSGIYICRLKSGSVSESRKLVILK